MEFKTNKSKTWLEDENGRQVALLDHPENENGIVIFAHTEVDDALSGQGIAGKITEFAAKKLRSEGKKAELSCSYSIQWFSNHPQYQDILADPKKESEKAAILAGPACSI